MFRASTYEVGCAVVGFIRMCVSPRDALVHEELRDRDGHREVTLQITE
jgi:hypothetical protein